MMSGKAGPPTQVVSNSKQRGLSLQGLLCFTFIFFKERNKNAINSNRIHVSLLVPEEVTILFIFLYEKGL